MVVIVWYAVNVRLNDVEKKSGRLLSDGTGSEYDPNFDHLLFVSGGLRHLTI